MVSHFFPLRKMICAVDFCFKYSFVHPSLLSVVTSMIRQTNKAFLLPVN